MNKTIGNWELSLTITLYTNTLKTQLAHALVASTLSETGHIIEQVRKRGQDGAGTICSHC